MEDTPRVGRRIVIADHQTDRHAESRLIDAYQRIQALSFPQTTQSEAACSDKQSASTPFELQEVQG